MKNLNFLSNLCGLGRASQSSDVGSRCRVVADLLPSFCRVNHVLTLLVVMLFTIGVGNVWGADTELTFSLTSNPGGWPTTNSTTLTNYTYTLSGTNYTFALSNVKQNSGYLMLTSTAVLGLPAISGMTLTKVVVSNSSGCSTSTRVGISSSSSSASYISGGAYQTYSTTSSTYTYNLTGTSANTMYYLYVTNKNCQITQLKLTYSGGSTPSLTASPTSLDWGSVAKGTSLSTKTFSISGSNLTSGSLSITASSGWSVSPTSKSVSGTLDPTTITVTPPSTSTAGTKNGTITISGGGLASSVVVNLSLTVNEVDNFIDVVQSTSGYTEGSPHQETGSYSTPTLTDKSVATSGTCEELHYHFVGWITKTKYDAGTSIAVGDLQTPTSATGTTYYAVWAKQAAGGSSNSISLTYTDFGYTSTTYSTKSVTKGGFTFTCKQGCRSNSPYSLQMNSTKTGHLYNTTAIAGLQSVTLKCNATNTGKTATIYQGASQEPTSSSAGTAACAASKNYTINITSGSYFTIAVSGATYFSEVVITYSTITYEDYIAKCCDDPGLAYGTGSVTKTYGNDPFTNPLTNSHSVAVTYALSSVSPAGCVSINNSTGQVTINGAGSATVTASFAGNATYCADEASYTLTVNKANISPTLTYSPNSVAVGENSATPTVGGNTGSGTVTYAITSASPAGCASINTSTGVVTGLAVGSVTVTATIGATDNYNGNTATATVTITAASNFPNNKTIFIQAGKSGSAWSDNACVVAWFHSYGGSETAQPTYWLFDVTAEGDDKGKKLFAAVVPSSGDLPYLDINRYASNCTTPWNKNGGVSYSDASGSNTIRSEGSGNDQVYWNLSGVTIDLHGDPSGDEWASSLASFSDQGAGVWTATYNNYAPANAAGESQEFKAKTNYNGWIGNTGSNNNATLDGMHVGSTYNITATLDVTDHSLTMSKTFVKGTVHFDLQGHGLAISDLTNVTAGSKISAPSPAPSATGYDFGGWYKEPACTNAWNFGSDVVNETMTLYAKWTKQTYTITSTLNNCSSSPAIPSSYEYTGSAASLSYTITPSSGYRLPTDITVTGTTYTWNSSTGALVLTGTITSNVTITISAVQTHTVDWYVGGSAPANKIDDDGQTTVVDHGGKIEDFPATTPDGSPCDKTFVGWTNTKSYTHGTSLLFNDVAGSPTIDADASFYAVFATGGDYSWTRVTSVATITGGGTFIIGYEGDYENNPGVLVPMQNANATATTSANGLIRCGDASNEFNNNTITMGSLGNHGGDDYEVIISEGTTSGTIAIQMADGNYIGKPTSGNNAKLFAAKGACTNITPVIGDDDVVRLKFNNDSSLQFNNNSSQYRFARYKNTQQDVVLYKKTGGLSGFTITCADCGSSVTPTYTAAPTGGTVSVTKSATPVSSGSTVKTCTAVDLTVTLTPATHYDLTGFTATGLTTGTATITPAVGSTLPVSVAQTFTVTVSAGATGTLTLAPTFTAQTPLSITLETHSKGTFTPIGDIYSGESFTFPTVTPSDAECSSFLGWIEGTTWSGDGTETDPTAITGLANYHAAGSSSGTLTTTKTYTAVFGEKDTQVIPAYQKVTSAPSNWSGDYLIVRDANSRAFDGSLSTLDAADNYIGVTISEGSITANSTVNASKWTIAKVGATSNYTIKSASGYYIGRTANSNGLNSSTSEAYTNTLSYSVDHVVITSSGGPTLQMNSGTRFRYYTSSQQALQLYKYNPDAEVVSYTYTTNPACTPRYRVTISSATGGSPEADKTYEHADETITITANPAAGYSFTSWTITKTTGGDNVTSTLLTGDKPTTANTTFTMPAYDITIAATYTKKMVSTLEVKDGATVVSTTTGPVSGTVNISTGANKTLDVVITPSDAYDHSWTATVSAGSTYASITNVTDDGFRVNGLAQGDATITVNAPNDGSAKSVTLTVQVRDIMPEEIILKRDGSNTPIETLIMYYDETNSKGQYVKVNVGYSPANPTNKAFTFSSALTGKVGSHSHAPASGYEVLVANGVTSDAVNCTFTSSADGSVTKVLAVTVLPILSDRFVDYVHGNATQTVSARLSDDRYSIIPDINTPSLSDASDANPTSEDCETSHYHLVGWLPQTTAEALWAASTPITDATEGLVRAGESVEATGQTWCAIWAEEQ